MFEKILRLRQLLIISLKSCSYCTARLCFSIYSYRPFCYPKDSSQWCLKPRNLLIDRVSSVSMSLQILAAAFRFQECCLLVKKYFRFCWKYSFLKLSRFWIAGFLFFSYLTLAISVSCLRYYFQGKKVIFLLEMILVPPFGDQPYILIWFPVSMSPFSLISLLESPYCF